MHKNRLGLAHFGVTTFFSYTVSNDKVGADGLPVTPSAVRILGRFPLLKELSHKNLCAYIDIGRLKNERMVIVAEYYKANLEDYFRNGTTLSVSDRQRMCFEIVDALAYLNRNGVVHRNLSPSNILLTPEGSVKLYQYGLYYMTEGGKDVCFPIGFPRYLAPEVIATGSTSPIPEVSSNHESVRPVINSCKVDVWALGVILLELFLGQHIYADLFLRNAIPTMLGRILLLISNHNRNAVHPLDSLLEAHGAKDKKMEENFPSFLYACLDPSPANRLTSKELLSHAYLSGVSIPVYKKEEIMVIDNCFRTPKSRVKHLVLPEYRFLTTNETPEEVDHLTELLISEVYYLWCLAGGDLEGELKKAGIIRTQPPVCRLPSILTKDGSVYGLERDRVFLYDDSTHVLSCSQLRKRLKGMTTLDYYPLLEGGKKPVRHHDSVKLPIIIKEKDVEYQFHRLILFNRLLQGYPYTRDRVLQQARIDISPFFRAEVWAVLLGVKGDIQADYMLIDKKSYHDTDKQIAVDVPRCHQYEGLLASPTGHDKFTRVLKSWVIHHEPLGLVYWQGLDSLCAPFLTLNFNNEALAYACLKAFIDKYLYNFFKKNNSPIMREYLAVFRHLIAFHDPELFNHLDEIGFNPELYAIPWFLTMFTHVLPLHKIYHLWDTLLLGNCAFPLCVGVAILKQVRDVLMSYDFNECITLFSDMPDIDIQMCVLDSIKFFRATPRSACLRKYELDTSQLSDCPEAAMKKPLLLKQLKAESCAQVSCHDLITLCELEQYMMTYDSDSSNKTVKKSEQKKHQKATLVDIRPWDEFMHGHVPGAINLPHSQTFTPEGNLISNPSSQTLASHKGMLIIVMGKNSENESHQFAANLLKLCYPRVCVLYGGIDALKKLGLLCSVEI